MYEEIKRKILEVSDALDQEAVFHYQVLKYAKVLANDDPHEFCIAVGMPDNYADEFLRIIRLAQVTDS